MPRASRVRIGEWLAAACLAAMLTGCGESGNRNSSGGSDVVPVDSVVDDLQGIVVLCNSPDSGIDEDTKTELVDSILAAQDAWRSEMPCAPQLQMDEFLEIAQEHYDPRVQMYERLYNLGRSVFRDMLLTRNWDCVGRDRLIDDEEARIANPVELLASDIGGFAAVFHFPEPSMQSVFVGPDGEEIFTDLRIPGLDLRNGQPGEPSIPSIKRLVAVPAGHTLELSSAIPHVAETLRLNLYPKQPEPIDQAGEVGDEVPDPEFFADRQFALDDDLYSTDRFYPAETVNVVSLGQLRDYHLYQVELFSGQYNPVRNTLRLFDRFSIEATFNDARDDTRSTPEEPAFVTEASFSPFESSGDLFLGAVLNSEAVKNSPPAPQFPGDIVPADAGEEFIILSHPDFRDAADALAAWKNEKGILTTVFDAGWGVADRETKEEIRKFLDDRYANSIVRPSYVLLLGDAEFIEPWYFVEQGGDPGDMIGTDWGYARQKPTNEIVFFTPQFAVGRIPVDTLDQAAVVVNKIITYEANPTDFESFYEEAALVGQFQCCRADVEKEGTSQRTYIEVLELVRHLLVTKGYEVQRIYTRTIDGGKANADPPVPPYTGDPTPRFIYSGAPLPEDIGPDSGFPGFGSASTIRGAFFEGRFLIVHRDHGSSTSWINPKFTTDDIDSLLNHDRTPVVFSINCTTGIFDNETSDQFSDSSVYFAERLLRKSNGGSVGIIGDSRVSPSWANSAFTRGLFDAIWPDFIPNFGGDKSFRRLGDILNHAKLYLWTQVGATGISGGTVINEMYLWHVIGDPTLEIWTSNPHNNDLPLAFAAEQHEGSLIVDYAINGATITAFQQIPLGAGTVDESHRFVPIGRGVVENGQAQIDHFRDPEREAPIRLSVSNPDSISVELIGATH